jgi:flagellar hook-associated protein 3 FlgL
MTITTGMLYNQILASLQSGASDYSRLSNELSAQKKLLAPSDDVVGAERAIAYRLDISNNTQFSTNITAAQNRLTTASTSLTSFSGALAEIRSMAQAVVSGTNDPSMRTSYALQTTNLQKYLSDLANTKLGDQYLFSGFRTNVQPYTAAGAYNYQGDTGVTNVSIGNGSAMPVNVPGSSAFSYQEPASSVTLSNGLVAQYTPIAGTTTTQVDILDPANGNAVTDTFQYSNAIQLTGLVSAAITANTAAGNTRLEALIAPLENAQNQSDSVNAQLAVRQVGLKDQATLLSQRSTDDANQLSSVEDADLNQVGLDLTMVSTSLDALRSSANKILSHSLFDFLS